MFVWLKKNWTVTLLGLFYLFALFNPLFKKYDYGAGYPLILLLGVLLPFFAIRYYKEKSEFSIYEHLFLLLFLLAYALSFVFSQTQNFGFSEVLAYFSVVTVYFIFAFRKVEWMEKFLKLVAFSAFAAVLLGYVFYFYQPETRMFGAFFNINYHANVWPNAFAMFILLTWPVFLFLDHKKEHWKLAILIGFILSGLLLTFSRGALIAFGGQLVLMFLYYFKRLDANKVFCAILTGVLAVGLFVSMNNVREVKYEVIDVSERAAFSNDEGLTSKKERFDFWLGAIELTKEKPLLGWGPFSFRQAYNPIQKDFLANADHPHNLFLKLSAENGLIAVGAFVAFLITIFATIVRRWSKLSKGKRDQVALLGIAVLGVLAHNLIDYNLNFAANILLLFLLLAFMRSLVVQKTQKNKSILLPLTLSLALAIVSLYEGFVLAYDQITYDKSELHLSLFPRNHYLNNAEFGLYYDLHDLTLEVLNKQLQLNPLDSRAYYLKGVIYCKDEKFELCEENLERALKLDPLNDLEYYVAYVRSLEAQNKDEELRAFVEETTPLLQKYFGYVENNVHFTAYTPNVEAAAQLVQLILPYISAEKAVELQLGKNQMLETAEKLRSEKSF